MVNINKTRLVALEKGLLTYSDDTLCKRGHVAERYVSSNNCIICMRERTPRELSEMERRHKKIRILKSGAKKRNIPFDLTVEDVEWTDKCPILGTPFYKGAGKNHPYSASFDRIDNTKGYIKGNVVLISRRANLIKGDGSLLEIQKVLNYLTNPEQIINNKTPIEVSSQRRKDSLENIKTRAIKRKKIFTLSEDDLIFNAKCPVLGIDMDYKTRATTPSFDRIDNTEGYTPANIFCISTKANRLKSDATADEMSQIVNYVKRNSCD